jgi:hypothetical protein
MEYNIWEYVNFWYTYRNLLKDLYKFSQEKKIYQIKSLKYLITE